MKENEAIVQWLAEGLRQPGRTQRGLARALGIDPASVNRLLKGVRKLAVREIEPVARYLGIPAPSAYCPRENPTVERYIDLPPDLRSEVFARAMELGIEPEEFLARAVRGAIGVLGPTRGSGAN